MPYPDAIKWLNDHNVKKTVTREDGSEVEEDFVIGDVSGLCLCVCCDVHLFVVVEPFIMILLTILVWCVM